MTIQHEVIAALRNAVSVAEYVEAAPIADLCPSACVIRCLGLCATGLVLIAALDVCWQQDHPVDTPATVILQSAHDALVCRLLEKAL